MQRVTVDSPPAGEAGQLVARVESINELYESEDLESKNDPSFSKSSTKHKKDEKRNKPSKNANMKTKNGKKQSTGRKKYEEPSDDENEEDEMKDEDFDNHSGFDRKQADQSDGESDSEDEMEPSEEEEARSRTEMKMRDAKEYKEELRREEIMKEAMMNDELMEEDPFIMHAQKADKIEATFSHHVQSSSRPGRKIRASVTTRMLGNLQRESQHKSTWVTGLLYFDHDPGFEVVQEVLIERLMSMPRFRACMKGNSFPIPQKIHFVEIDLKDFDIDYHLNKVLDDHPATDEEINHFVEQMYSGWEPDMSKPLWQLHYVPQMVDGRACLITKISHVIGDGVSQIEVLLRMLDPPTDEEEAKLIQESRPPAKKMKKAAFGPLNKLRFFLGGVWSGVFNVFSASDPANSLRPANTSDCSDMRRFAFTDKIPLDRMKEVKNKLQGATLNDVLVLVLTLTLRQYFRESGDQRVLNGSKVSAQFPVSTRMPGEQAFRNEDPRNQFSYGFLRFHLTFKGSDLQLFWKIKRDLDKLKLSPAPFVTTRVAKMLIPVLPLKTCNQTVLQAANKATGQLSNVAAPSRPCKIAGAHVTDMSFLLFSPLALYLGILSYNNKVSASICIEANLGVDPNEIAKHWKTQFDSFYDEVMAQEGDIPQKRRWYDFM